LLKLQACRELTPIELDHFPAKFVLLLHFYGQDMVTAAAEAAQLLETTVAGLQPVHAPPSTSKKSQHNDHRQSFAMDSSLSANKPMLHILRIDSKRLLSTPNDRSEGLKWTLSVTKMKKKSTMEEWKKTTSEVIEQFLSAGFWKQ